MKKGGKHTNTNTFVFAFGTFSLVGVEKRVWLDGGEGRWEVTLVMSSAKSTVLIVP